MTKLLHLRTISLPEVQKPLQFPQYYKSIMVGTDLLHAEGLRLYHRSNIYNKEVPGT